MPQKKEQVKNILRCLRDVYPDVRCALHFETPWQLLAATILSAQCTDKRVNQVTPVLFKKYPDALSTQKASLQEVEGLIHSTGFYHHKAKNILGAAKMVCEKYEGKVPGCLEDLVLLPGVGRKTANVVLGNVFGIPGLTVDTHMIRLNRLLGLTKQKDAEKIERELMKLVPQEAWTEYSHLIILHGRARCVARRPDCTHCEIRKWCRYGRAKSKEQRAKSKEQRAKSKEQRAKSKEIDSYERANSRLGA